MSRAEKAKEYFLQGYACSQAVALAFADVMGMQETDIVKIMLPFGGGMGRLRLTCGAVSGMAMVIGKLCAGAENTPENKADTYALTRELCTKFQEECGSLICAELLEAMNVTAEVGGTPEARTQEYYKKRSCAEIVYAAAAIVEKYLQEKGIL
jgi:C_GCAxxG_C_C family probable redox protein